ncbi:MAG: hypothetical protein ACRDTQ_03390 [Micromonosporaceae bacterium]
MSPERVSAGIELAFDVDTEERIRALWAPLEEVGVATSPLTLIASTVRISRLWSLTG